MLDSIASFLKFRNRILKCTVAIALLAAVVSLVAHGPDRGFLLGLAAGTATTVVNFSILEYTAMMLMDKGRAAPVVTGYFIRLPIYGLVFYLCIRVDLAAAVGCALGFVTLHLALLFLYGIRSWFPGAEKNPLNDWKEPKEWNDPADWDEDEDDWGPLPPWTDPKKKKSK